MGLDVSAGLLYGILVRRDELVMPGPEVKQCVRYQHRYDLAVDFRYCPQCSAELVVETTLVPLPAIVAVWPDFPSDPETWNGETETTWAFPARVSFHNASQTRGSGEGRDVPATLLLGVGLVSSASNRSGRTGDVCSVKEHVLEMWRPRILGVARKAGWDGRPLELVVSSYLSY